MSNTKYCTLSRQENQARGIGCYALQFIGGSDPGPATSVLDRLSWFCADSMACGVAALAYGLRAPWILRQEALGYQGVQPEATLMGGVPAPRVAAEKAVLANCSAVRELDANGTNFGYNPRTGDRQGEFGHNDYYPAVIAAAQQARFNGQRTLLAMLCLDEIRGRLAEVFALHRYKIDHVLHGAIATAAVYGACLGASAEAIESAVGLVVAHFVPFRAIRAGQQLSDSKGASAALAAETAVLSVHRALAGFQGPRDIFRNSQALFCLFEPPQQSEESPFDLHLAVQGDDFAVMNMHFKLGLYEHQSASAIQGLINVLSAHPHVLQHPEEVTAIRITIYEPAYSIIGGPAKLDPRNRQSADHSMVYIAATVLRKAVQQQCASWSELMLMPEDYSDEALVHPHTRRWMQKIEFIHGGSEYDQDYPAGIPTRVELEHRRLGRLDSGKVLFPLGHASCPLPGLTAALRYKLRRLTKSAVTDPDALIARFVGLGEATAQEVQDLYDFEVRFRDPA